LSLIFVMLEMQHTACCSDAVTH